MLTATYAEFLMSFSLTEGLSTIDLLIRVSCFAKKVNNILNIKGANLNYTVHGMSTALSLPLT
jgi:hypothetical protein